MDRKEQLPARAQRHALRLAAALCSCLLPLASGCGSPETAVGFGVAGVAVGTAVLAGVPSDDLEQVYFLGTIDPLEQVPPTIYRITVRGQSSALNRTRYASGWVRAELVDSLSSRAGFDGDTEAIAGTGPAQPNNELGAGRRMVMFGPDGFRDAPRNHRLVIVMGGDPAAFFSAMDDALGAVAKVQVERTDSAVHKQLASRLDKLRRDRDRVQSTIDDLGADAAGRN